MTQKTVQSWFIAIFLFVGLGISFYLGDAQARPGASTAVLFGVILWFMADLRRPDVPFGMVVGGAMGLIEWQDGLKFWFGLFALACFWCAWSTYGRQQRGEA